MEMAKVMAREMMKAYQSGGKVPLETNDTQPSSGEAGGMDERALKAAEEQMAFVMKQQGQGQPQPQPQMGGPPPPPGAFGGALPPAPGMGMLPPAPAVGGGLGGVPAPYQLPSQPQFSEGTRGGYQPDAVDDNDYAAQNYAQASMGEGTSGRGY